MAAGIFPPKRCIVRLVSKSITVMGRSPLHIELVASFANRLNLLKYGEKMYAYAASLPLERPSKRGSDHAHSILHTAWACRALF